MGQESADSNGISEQLALWIPIRVEWRQTEPFIDWCYFGERRFTEPFFDQTINKLLRRPFNVLFRRLTPINVLEECHARRPGLQPSGFIFHMSRCGSTLISQMLAALPQNVVISEASPLDWMIRANIRRPEITDDERIEWIECMASALGQKRHSQERHFFIKFDSWHIFELDLIERAFPGVPWIFLYRNPLEVMVSQNKQRGAGFFPGILEHVSLGLNLPEALKISLEEYTARVLARICETALEHKDNPNGLFVNYTQLPEAVALILSRHFRVNCSGEDIAGMNAAARFDAKSPKSEFVNDAEKKQREASETIHQLSDKWLMPLYKKMEIVRRDSADM